MSIFRGRSQIGDIPQLNNIAKSNPKIFPSIFTWNKTDRLIYNVACSEDLKYIYVVSTGMSTNYLQPYYIDMSSDYGVTWTNKYTSATDYFGMYQLTCSKDGKNVIFFGNKNCYYTTDFGANFNTVIIDSNISGMYPACSSNDGSIVYLATVNSGSAKLYKSINYGATWNIVLNSLSEVRSIDCSADGSIVYYISQSSAYIYKSINGGVSFSTYASPAGIPSNILCDDSGDNVVYASGTTLYKNTTPISSDFRQGTNLIGNRSLTKLYFGGNETFFSNVFRKWYMLTLLGTTVTNTLFQLVHIYREIVADAYNPRIKSDKNGIYNEGGQYSTTYFANAKTPMIITF